MRHWDIKEAALRDMRGLQRGRYLLDTRLEKEMRSRREVLITACCCVSDVAPRCLPRLCGSISKDLAALKEKVMIYSQVLGWAGSSSHPLGSLLPLFSPQSLPLSSSVSGEEADAALLSNSWMPFFLIFIKSRCGW